MNPPIRPQPSLPLWGRAGEGARSRPTESAASIGLWVLIGVSCTLFALFVAAYVMRMEGDDWSPLALPWQLALSTTLLAGTSAALQRCGHAWRHAEPQTAQHWYRAAGVLALAFLAVQGWAWQSLLAQQVRPTGNPAASFFYLLTALHALHVVGGLVGWTWGGRDTARRVSRVARWWHVLLGLWLLLYATLEGLTPALVQWICGTQ